MQYIHDVLCTGMPVRSKIKGYQLDYVTFCVQNHKMQSLFLILKGGDCRDGVAVVAKSGFLQFLVSFISFCPLCCPLRAPSGVHALPPLNRLRLCAQKGAYVLHSGEHLSFLFSHVHLPPKIITHRKTTEFGEMGPALSFLFKCVHR